MEVMRFNFKIDKSYKRDLNKFFNKKIDNIDGYVQKIKKMHNDDIYEIELMIDIFDSDFAEMEVSFKVNFGYDYDYITEMVNCYEGVFNVREYKLNDNLTIIISVEEDSYNYSSYKEYFKSIYHNINLYSDVYLDTLVTKLSLSDEVERFQFISAIFLNKSLYGSLGSNETMNFVREKLEFYGYDEHFAKNVPVFTDQTNSKDLFEYAMAMLIFYLNGEEVHLGYHNHAKALYMKYLDLLKEEGYFKKAKRLRAI